MDLLTITDEAAKAIRNISKQEGHAKIELKVKPGGCFGFTYQMDAAHENYDDTVKVLQSNGISVIVDSATFVCIVGLNIDYDGGFNGKGFIYDNPSATKNCHCGISFSTK